MEDAIIFGNYDHLFGVWCQPDSDGARDTAVVFVTAGMLHHAGPFRLHVDLARTLGARGIASLRFDLSGIGESFGVGVGGCSLDRAADEIGQAIDWIHGHAEIENAVVFGLCSGADDALHAAKKDHRIAGVIAMDGCGYRTRRYYWHRLRGHYLRRMMCPSKWKGVTTRLFCRSFEEPRTLQSGSDIREFPPRDESARDLAALADRGTRLHFIYTGGVGDYYNYEEQFVDMFPELADVPQVSSCFFPSMDHVALFCEDRATLVEHIVREVSEIISAAQPMGHIPDSFSDDKTPGAAYSSTSLRI